MAIFIDQENKTTFCYSALVFGGKNQLYDGTC